MSDQEEDQAKENVEKMRMVSTMTSKKLKIKFM